MAPASRERPTTALVASPIIRQLACQPRTRTLIQGIWCPAGGLWPSCAGDSLRLPKTFLSVSPFPLDVLLEINTPLAIRHPPACRRSSLCLRFTLDKFYVCSCALFTLDEPGIPARYLGFAVAALARRSAMSSPSCYSTMSQYDGYETCLSPLSILHLLITVLIRPVCPCSFQVSRRCSTVPRPCPRSRPRSRPRLRPRHRQSRPLRWR